MIRRALVILVVPLGLLGLAAPAAAQTSKEAPGRIAPARATSACLGTVSSTTCAAETLLACLTRGDAALCQAVGAAVAARPADEPPLQSEYVIERESLIRPEDVSEDLRDVEWYKPGYALIEILRRNCPAAQADCAGEAWDDLQVYLRQAPSGPPAWEAVHWRSDSEPDIGPDIPEAFLRKPPAAAE